MRQTKHKAPRLPKQLLDQLGDSSSHKSKNRPVPGRKEQRKAERADRKSLGRRPRLKRTEALPKVHSESEESDSRDELSNFVVRASDVPQNQPKPILKKRSVPKAVSPEIAADNSLPPQRPLSRREKEHLEEDDAEIAALEKRLGLTGKKTLPKAFADDGLDFLLEGLDGTEPHVTDSHKRKRTEDDEWLEMKRQKSKALVDRNGRDPTSEDTEDEASSEFLASLSEDDPNPDIESEQSTASLEDELLKDEFDLSENESEAHGEDQIHRVKENPYVAPGTTKDARSKYIPPALRPPTDADAESLQRLKRQSQGLLNRLSEANILSIVKDVERLYQNNARQHVTSTLVDLLLQLVCDRTTLLDTFIILHAGFIAALYKVVGVDFGAQIIEDIASRFDQHYGQSIRSGAESKEPSNLISLLAELYNFGVVGSNLMFDYIRMFLSELSEPNTELLLRIIKNSGPQLRQDDPASLKDIVGILQKAVVQTGETNLSIRTKFMIETINNLKNNRMKTGLGASALVQEHTARMKKVLGSLNARSTKASEPLRMGLKDLRETEKRGKWWLVGASWRDTPAQTVATGVQEFPFKKQVREEHDLDSEEDFIGSGTTDLNELARDQRMNTDVRRAIFMAIMSATDFKDAQMKLMKLKLRKSQVYEIPRVLLHCVGAEEIYNPYYTLIARRVCMERKLRKAFEFNLWDLFRRFGERHEEEEASDDDEDDASEMSMSKLVNLGRLYGTLIADGGLPITSLRPLNFAYLQAKTKVFTEVMLVTVMLCAQKNRLGEERKTIEKVFAKVAEVPQMAAGLQYFLKEVISRGHLAATKSERSAIRKGSKAAARQVAMVVRAAGLDG